MTDMHHLKMRDNRPSCWPSLWCASVLQVDFVEVYQDQVRDLLINPNEDGTTRMPAIDIRESPTQGIFLEGVRYAAVPTVSSEIAVPVMILLMLCWRHCIIGASVYEVYNDDLWCWRVCCWHSALERCRVVILRRILVMLACCFDRQAQQKQAFRKRKHSIASLPRQVALLAFREVEVKTETDIAQLLEAGNGHRAVAAHNLNDASSRSHAIFTMTLEQRRKPNAPADSKAPKFLKSKLHLVDLAGLHLHA